MDIKMLVPPILWRLRPTRLTELRDSCECYDSYDCALADSHSYEDPDVVHIVASKTEAYRNALLAGDERTVDSHQTVQNMFVLSHIRRDRPLGVLELGGACGASYFELRRLLPGSVRSWHIVETPAMATAGRRRFQDHELIFHDDLNSAASQLVNLDLLIAQGVLQYMRDPLQTLETLLGFGFAYVYITRTVVGDGIEDPVITRQIVNLSAHGPGAVPQGFPDRETSQPLTIVPSGSIAHRVAAGHRVLYSFVEGDGTPMRFGSRIVRTRTVGFLVKKVPR